MEDPSEKYHFAFDEQIYLPSFAPTIEPSALVTAIRGGEGGAVDREEDDLDDADGEEEDGKPTAGMRTIAGITDVEQKELARL